MGVVDVLKNKFPPGPVAPVAPVAPVTPAPVGPVEPVDPVIPALGPVGPGGPVGPLKHVSWPAEAAMAFTRRISKRLPGVNLDAIFYSNH